MTDNKDLPDPGVPTPPKLRRYVAPRSPDHWQKVIECLGPVTDITSFCDVLWDDADRTNIRERNTWLYSRGRNLHYKHIVVKNAGDGMVTTRDVPVRDAPARGAFKPVCDLSTLRFHFDGGTVIDATWMPDHSVYTVVRLSEDGRQGDDTERSMPDLPRDCSAVVRKAHACVKEYLLSSKTEDRVVNRLWKHHVPLHHDDCLPQALTKLVDQFKKAHPEKSHATELAMWQWGSLHANGLETKAAAARSTAVLGQDLIDNVHTDARKVAPRVWRHFQPFAENLTHVPIPDVFGFEEEDDESGGGCFIEIRWLLNGVHVYCNEHGVWMGAQSVDDPASFAKDVCTLFKE